jgi:hypothetical protein
LTKPARDAVFAAVFAAVLGVILAPLCKDFWVDMRPALDPPLVALIGIFILVAIAAFGLAVLHYFRALGAGPALASPREQNGHDGNWIAREYARRLNTFLNAVDRFFGDAEMADQTWFPHAFGLRKPAPLWTTPAFDRCLLLAFFYLIVAIVIIWAVGNRVGPAEAALGLHATDDWRRAATLVAIGFLTFAVRRVVHDVKRWRFLAWLIVAVAGAVGVAIAGSGIGDVAVALTFAGAFAVALPVAFVVALAVGFALLLAAGSVAIAAASDRDRLDATDAIGTLLGLIGGLVAFAVAAACAVAGAAAFAFAVAGTGAYAFAGAFAVAVAFAYAVALAGAGRGVGSPAVAIAFAVAVAFAGAGTGAGTVAFAVTVIGTNVVIFMPEWHRIAPSVVLVVMIVVCFADVALLARLADWQIFGPLLLFLGPITLTNGTFDWLSLGLTRALIRRGLERGKCWPYFYAFIDALLAPVVIVFLAAVMVAAVQLFDDIAVYSGGQPVFPPMREFLDAIKANPGKPEYWWVYATLFSTMLPSLINLFIAGVSLARDVPGLSSWLAGKVREGEAVPSYDRLLVAIVLALQGVIGAAIAVLAQGLLFWVIVWQGMPRLGIGVLDLAHYVAH